MLLPTFPMYVSVLRGLSIKDITHFRGGRGCLIEDVGGTDDPLQFIRISLFFSIFQDEILM